MKPEGSITFQFLYTPFRLKNRKAVRSWISTCLEINGQYAAELTFLFTTDQEMLRLNQEHLKHDYFTDILTFPKPSGQGVSADIVISIDRVRENAKTLGNRTLDETHRVMAHGVLHLTGLEDDTPQAQQQMRKAEDQWLSLRKEPLTTN